MDEKFLPIGQILPFNSGFGIILQSHEISRGQYKWKNVAVDASSTIQRIQKDKVKITIVVEHFCW